MTQYSPQWKETIQPGACAAGDMEYFQGMYPRGIKEIQRYVIWQCDAMDYDGSPIYDEYPEALMIERACRRVCGMIFQGWETGEVPEGEEAYVAGDDKMMQKYPGVPPSGERPPLEHLPGKLPSGERPPLEHLPGKLPSRKRPPVEHLLGDRLPGNPPPVKRPSGKLPSRKHPPVERLQEDRPPGNPPSGERQPGGRLPENLPPSGRPPGNPLPEPMSGNDWLSDIVKVLFMNEIQRRRCRMGGCWAQRGG